MKTLKKLLVTLLMLVLPVANAETAQRLPVEAFAGFPDVQQMMLSPSGTHVASMVRVTGAEKRGTAIHVLDLDTGHSTYPVFTDNKEMVLNWLRWASDDRLLVSARYPVTTENRLVIVDVRNGKTKAALPPSFWRGRGVLMQFQDNIIDILPDDPDNILLSLALASGSSRIIKLNLEDGTTSTVEGGKNRVFGWLSDRQHTIRIGIRFGETKYTIIHRAPGEKSWDTLWQFGVFSEDRVWPMGFDYDPQFLYVSAYHDDKLAIFRVDLSTANLERELVYSDPDYDVDGSLIYSHKSKKVIGTTYSAHGGFTFWDERYQALQNGLDRALPDTENILYSFSDDERHYIVLAASDNDAGAYYYGNRDSKELSYLGDRYALLRPELLAEKKRVTYRARDGLEIEAFLTIPKDTGDDSLPTIIFPHGGPISYDDGGFDYWTQFFANRGYAVMQMNFRGSSGYGYKFMASGLQNWGLEMQNDVEDGTRWAIEEGIADPERVGIVGASYGGYVALMEAARNPDLYQCAVSFAGVTDVVQLVQSRMRYTSIKIVKQQLGSDYKSLRQRSPVNRADDIGLPVLLVHGTKDRTVPIKHARKMFKALNSAGKDVIYIEQEDGDHSLSNQKYRLELFHAMDDFLRKHLAPKPEGLGPKNNRK